MHSPAQSEPRDALTLRQLTEADLPRLADWIDAEHVRRWWYEPLGLDQVREEYLPIVHGLDPTVAGVVELDGRPAGFAQWYRWADNSDHATVIGADVDEAGFDYLLAYAADCGRGLGTRLVAEIIAQVRRSWPSIQGLVVDPEEGNRASCRVLEKNGLRLASVLQISPNGHEIGPTAVYRRRFSARPR